MKLSAVFLKYSVVVNDMNLTKVIGLSLCVLAANGCSITPDKNNLPVFDQSSIAASSANTARTQAVASASVCVPQVYSDELSGKTVELVVESEYFSANGRVCRRFSEFVGGRDVAGVSCLDEDRGWTEIPLSSFVR